MIKYNIKPNNDLDFIDDLDLSKFEVVLLNNPIFIKKLYFFSPPYIKNAEPKRRMRFRNIRII